MTKAELSELDAMGSAELIHGGQVSAKELVQAAIERIESTNPNVNAVVIRRYEKALAEAEDIRLKETAFGGVPILLKDIDGESAGDPSFAGSRFLKRIAWVDVNDCFAVARLKAAGLIVVGKSATPEFSLSMHTRSEAHGLTRNPWNLERSAGGSSGGSGAAVAAHMVPIAHGSDCVGSIRVPASWNGVVGLRPTRGRVSNGPGEGDPWGGLGARGVLTRTVRDTAAAMDHLSIQDLTEPYSAITTSLPYVTEIERPMESLRVGFLDRRFDGTLIDADVAQTVRKVAELLAEGGCQVEESYPPALCDFDAERLMTITSTWLEHALDTYVARTGQTPLEEELEPTTLALLDIAKKTTAVEYVKTREALHAVARKITAWWNNFDLLVTATMASPAHPHELFLLTRPEDRETLLRECVFTPAFSVTGQPAISLPLGMSHDGLPIGVQLIAAPSREDVLFRAAAFLEIAAPWAGRKPALCA